MAGGPLGFLFGSKPKVPAFKPIDPTAEQAASIAGNVSVLPAVQNLASGVNQLNMSELAKALEFALPGGLKAVQANVTNQLGGIADIADTKAGIRNATAAGWGAGVAGSRFGNLNVLGQLGRSIAQQRQTGFQQFLQLTHAVTPSRLDPTSMFLSPQQRVSLASEQNQMQYQRDLQAAQVAASASPFGSFIAGLGTSFLGGAAGQFGMKMANKTSGFFSSIGQGSELRPKFGLPGGSSQTSWMGTGE